MCVNGKNSQVFVMFIPAPPLHRPAQPSEKARVGWVEVRALIGNDDLNGKHGERQGNSSVYDDSSVRSCVDLVHAKDTLHKKL